MAQTIFGLGTPEDARLFRLMYDLAPVGIAHADAEGQCLRANPKFRELIGYTIDELHAAGIDAIVCADDLAAEAPQRARLLAGEIASYECERRYVHKDGQLVAVRATTFRVPGEVGGCDSFVSLVQDDTERKRAESSLRESEQKYRSLFENAVEGVFQTSPEGRMLSANPALARMFGYDTAEELAIEVVDLGRMLVPDDQERERLTRIMHEHGFVSAFETQAHERNGERFWISINARPVRDAAGEYRFFDGSVEDITDRMRVFEALVESEERFRVIFEQSPIPCTITNIETGNYADVNEACCRAMGLSRENVIGRKVDELGIWFSSEATRECLNRLAVEGAIDGMEAELCRSDFRPMTALLFARFIEIQGERYVLSSVMDTTPQTRAERALRESEARFRAAFDTSPAAITVSALDTGMIVDANRTFCDALGRPREEVVGRTSKELGIWKTWDLREDLVRRIREGAEVDGVEATVVKGDGSEALYSVSLRRVLLDGVAHLLLYGVDISERKRFEAQRADFERQLTQLQRVEAIGTLAGGIAHDFNNILGAIVGCTEMVQMSISAEPSVHEDLERVLEAARRATALVRQILAFARQTKEEVASVAPKPIMEEALKLLRATLPANILIAEELGTDATVLADPSQLHQIVMNLCTNAGLAMRDGGGTLRVALDEVDVDAHEAERMGVVPGRFVRLTVADTGCGMPPEVLGRVFEPFFTTRPVGQGTGLGLSVVHGIVHGRGGAISAASEVGRGTEFRVCLPIDDGKTPSDEPKRVPASPGTERILFVDDEVLLVEVTCRALEGLGYRVTGFTDSALALSAFRAEPFGFDLVVTDAMMPGLGGEQLVRELKALRPAIPVVVATGYSERITRESARALGFDGYLQKPVTAADVTALVRKLFDSGRFRAGAVAPTLA